MADVGELRTTIDGKVFKVKQCFENPDGGGAVCFTAKRAWVIREQIGFDRNYKYKQVEPREAALALIRAGHAKAVAELLPEHVKEDI